MDWLGRYEARIFCQDKEISLRHPTSNNRVIFLVENIDRSVSTSLNAMEVGNELSQVQVAREFADVFKPVTRLLLKISIEL